MHKIRINHVRACGITGAVAASVAFGLAGAFASGLITPAAGATVRTGSAEHVSAAVSGTETAANRAGAVLPRFVTVYRSRYRSGPHAAHCYVIGNGTHLNGIICTNGVAYSAAESNAGRPYPHGAAYSRRNLPGAVIWWGRPHNARSVVIGAGSADSTLLVTRREIRES